MLRRIRSRRPQRPRYGVYICAVISALLLLLSVSLLYTRLSHSQSHHFRHTNKNDAVVSLTSDDAVTTTSADDKIDELDEIIVDEEVEDDDPQSEISQVSGYFFDHVTGTIRRGFNKRKIEDWDEDYNLGFSLGSGSAVAFGSDDVSVDMEVRRRMSEVASIEDALLLRVGKRVSPLRDGWGEWFDKKSDFLRRDKMFKSNLDLLNPLHNPILQDLDAVRVLGFTRGDKALQKWWLSHFKKVPFRSGGSESKKNLTGGGNVSEVERAERKTLD